MLYNWNWPMPRGMVCVLMLLISCSGWSLTDQTQQAVRSHVPKAQLVGSGQYSYLFWDVYDGFLFAPEGQYQKRKPYALTLAYQRSLSGSSITDKTIELIKAQHPSVSKTQLKTWQQQLNNIFPDVTEQTELTGVYTDKHTVVFYDQNGQRLGEINNHDFANYFFDIWLAPDTTEPDFRDQLLGRD